MRSKSHVTAASNLVVDIDGIVESDFVNSLDKLKNDGIAFVTYTTHSNGDPAKPGMRARLIVPVDRPVGIDEYAAAWHGLDQHYWNGLAGKADSSGANLYQQQGVWCCHPDRVDQSQSWKNDGGITSADALIQLGKSVLTKLDNTDLPKDPDNQNTGSNTQYPPADANKIADRCKQIGAFRDLKGANQSEPLWHDCLGVVGYCQDGFTFSQDWSSGHSEYDKEKTAKKLEYRLKMPPTTCSQFRKTNPEGCNGCTQQCKSPITLGWKDRFENIKTPVISPDTPDKAIDPTPSELKVASCIPVITPTDDEVIATLASMKPIEYDRVRLEYAKALGIQLKTLDEFVKVARNQEVGDTNFPFPEVGPYQKPIVLALLLNEISEIIRRFVILDPEQADTAAL